jgi:hypothetical protein
MPTVKTDPVLEAIAKKLIGIEQVPKAEQAKMIKRAAKAAKEAAEVQRNVDEVKVLCPKCNSRDLTILCGHCEWDNNGLKAQRMAMLEDANRRANEAIGSQAEELGNIIKKMGQWSEEDEPLPEDEAIMAARPVETGDHDTYMEALRLVGAKRSKYALVDLVNWLLRRLKKPEVSDKVREIEQERRRTTQLIEYDWQWVDPEHFRGLEKESAKSSSNLLRGESPKARLLSFTKISGDKPVKAYLIRTEDLLGKSLLEMVEGKEPHGSQGVMCLEQPFTYRIHGILASSKPGSRGAVEVFFKDELIANTNFNADNVAAIVDQLNYAYQQGVEHATKELL